MFCQKCGRNIQDNEIVILDKRTLCRECAGIKTDESLNSNNAKTYDKRLSILLSVVAIVSLATAIILVLCLILPNVFSSDDKQHDHEIQPAIVYDDEESDGDYDEHTTHHGKCTICGEFILDEAFLPTENDYANVIMFNHISSEFYHEILNSEESGKSGFKAYVKIPDSERIEGLVPAEHDYVLNYYGDRQSNCLTQLYMYFEPSNKDDIDALYDAINAHYLEIYGVPYEIHNSKGKEFGRTWHDEKEMVSISTTVDDNCMAVCLELLDDDAPWLQDYTKPAVTTERVIIDNNKKTTEKIITTAPKKTATTTKATTKKTTTTTEKVEVPYNCPNRINFNGSGYGELQDTYFYDVDGDGKKETIGRYSNDCLRVYESNGSYVDCVFSPGASSFTPIAVVYDDNIEEYYISEIHTSCSNAGQGVTISDAITKEVYAEYSYSSPGGVFESVIYRVDGEDVSEETARDYMNNIEIISYSDKDIIKDNVEIVINFLDKLSPKPKYTKTNYLVEVNDYLPIYEGPGYNYSVAEYFTELTKYTIVEECRLSDSKYDVWGKLKSGAGWVNLYDVRNSYSQSSSGPTYTKTNYLIQVNDYLPIYEGPGYDYPVAEYFTELTKYTIVEECRLSDSEYDVWGKLKSGAGWVNIYDVQHSY